jgi:hypothetical protein
MGGCLVGMALASAIAGELGLSHAAAVEVRRRAEDAIVARAITDERGRFRVELPPGVFDLEIRPRVPAEAPDSAERNTFVLQDIGLMPDQTIHLPALQLHDYDRRLVRGSGAAPGALVAIWQQTIHYGFGQRLHADENGEFVVRVLEWADVTAEVRLAGGELLSGSCRQPFKTPPPECRMALHRGRDKQAAPVSEWVLPRLGAIPAGAVLQGSVDVAGEGEVTWVDLVASGQSRPPSHALVAAFAGGVCIDCIDMDLPWERFEFRGPAFEIRGLPAGKLLTRVTSAHSSRVLTAELRDRQTTKLDVRLFGRASVSARVINPGGVPLQLASACLEAAGVVLRCVDAGAEGKFRLDRLPAGRWNLRIGDDAVLIAAGPERAPVARAFDLAADEQLDLQTITVDLDARPRRH